MNQIFGVLEADGEAHEPFGDARAGFHVGGNARVGHARRVLGQTLGRAQAHGQLEHLKRVEEGKCALAAAGDFQADHGSASTLLLLGDGNVLVHLGEVGGPGRFDSLRSTHLAQVLQERAGGVLLSFHPDVERSFIRSLSVGFELVKVLISVYKYSF